MKKDVEHVCFGIEVGIVLPYYVRMREILEWVQIALIVLCVLIFSGSSNHRLECLENPYLRLDLLDARHRCLEVDWSQ